MDKKASIWADGKVEIHYGESSKAEMTLESCTEEKKGCLALAFSIDHVSLIAALGEGV